MKDQRQRPEDFIPVSPSHYADAVGLRGSIVHELIKRKEVQHFVDVQGRLRVWLDVSRWCKHPQEPLDWSKAPTFKPDGKIQNLESPGHE
jgi:hypothetical protein